MLQFAPSTYYAARARPPSPRALADEALGVEVARVHRDHHGVYGAEKSTVSEPLSAVRPQLAFSPTA